MGKIEYYTIFRWMREELYLAGAELECYAVIYSLSLGDNWYMAGVKNLVQLLEKSEPTIISALKNLTDKGLIVKEPVVINNTKRNYYKAKRTFDKQDTTLNDLSTPTLNDLSDINKINNKEIKEKSISKDIPKKGQRNKNFVKPTIEEIEAYIKSQGYKSSAEEFFNYHESGGWVIGRNRPMIDWRAAVRTWEIKEKKKRPTDYEVKPGDGEKQIKFKSYMRDKYPDIETAQKPLSFDGYMELVKDYGVDYVTEKLDHIVTYFGRYKSCDIYRLIKSWLSEDGRE